MKNKKQKGLSDTELIKKHESGEIDLRKPLKRMFKTPSNPAKLKTEKTT